MLEQCKVLQLVLFSAKDYADRDYVTSLNKQSCHENNLAPYRLDIRHFRCVPVIYWVGYL